MDASQNNDDEQFEDSLAGLDAFSADGQSIGRVAGFLPLVPEAEQAFEEGLFDTADSHGRPARERHVLIDAHGSPLQSRLVIERHRLQVDLRGRRVTVPLTVAEIEQLPQREPGTKEATLRNATDANQQSGL